jgi:hypothetical protein
VVSTQPNRSAWFCRSGCGNDARHGHACDPRAAALGGRRHARG